MKHWWVNLLDRHLPSLKEGNLATINPIFVLTSLFPLSSIYEVFHPVQLTRAPLYLLDGMLPESLNQGSTILKICSTELCSFNSIPPLGSQMPYSKEAQASHTQRVGEKQWQLAILQRFQVAKAPHWWRWMHLTFQTQDTKRSGSQFYWASTECLIMGYDRELLIQFVKFCGRFLHSTW